MNKTGNELILEYEKKRKSDRIQKIILIIIICILLLLWLVSWKLGKIGYNPDVEPSYPVLEENVPIIRVSDRETEITDNTEVNIFANQKYNNEPIVAPGSSGQYVFAIQNSSDILVGYNLEFDDVMTNPVNMKYRLKVDNVYIRGTKDEYISIDELNVEDIVVPEKSTNNFTLEWYWEDDDQKDTYTGSLEDDQHYTLRLNVRAGAYEE